MMKQSKYLQLKNKEELKQALYSFTFCSATKQLDNHEHWELIRIWMTINNNRNQERQRGKDTTGI